MNLCNTKQKAFAQRVYFDLKICRKWSKLHVYFDEINKWIFFLGKLTDDQSLTFVLPMSCDEQLTVDDLFKLRSKLISALGFEINENISSVLMAIVANDFTLGYFNFTYGFPTFIASDISQSEVQLQSSVISIDDEFTKEIITNEWNTTNPTASWD